MAELQDGWVTIRHPDLKDAPPSDVPLEAFELAWKDKGFEIVKDKSAKASKLETKES